MAAGHDVSSPDACFPPFFLSFPLCCSNKRAAGADYLGTRIQMGRRIRSWTILSPSFPFSFFLLMKQGSKMTVFASPSHFSLPGCDLTAGGGGDPHFFVLPPFLYCRFKHTPFFFSYLDRKDKTGSEVTLPLHRVSRLWI